MTTLEFLQEFVSPRCHKLEHGLTELNEIKSTPGVVMVKATTFYQIYKHNVFESNGRLSMQEFYQVCGQYFYYDKYVCTHGTEFYYYIVFNEYNQMYKITKDLIIQRINANNPLSLQDLLHIVPAVTKE